MNGIERANFKTAAAAKAKSVKRLAKKREAAKFKYQSSRLSGLCTRCGELTPKSLCEDCALHFKMLRAGVQVTQTKPEGVGQGVDTVPAFCTRPGAESHSQRVAS